MYEQLKTFYPKDMGKAKGWCLRNVAEGFHISPSPNPAPDAKTDMARNKAKGTFHNGLSDVPSNCAVPVYVKTTSKYGHVAVYDKGVFYNDGKKVNSLGTVLGWGEWCNGYQIVKRGATRSFLPAKGYWGLGDKDERIGKLALFMRQNFPAYTSAKALGPEFGKYLRSAIVSFQKRTGLSPDGYVGKLTYAKLKEYGFVYNG